MKKPDFLHGVMNLKQWLEYSSKITFPAFFFFQVLGTVGVILLYMGIEGDFGLLFKITFPIFLILFGAGYIFFIKEVQPTDMTMQTWRSVWFTFINTAFLQMLTEFGKREEFPIPDFLKEWGLDSWGDLEKLIKHTVEKGKKAKAQPIIKEFLEKRR